MDNDDNTIEELNPTEGKCKTNEQCPILGWNNHECISVDTNRINIDKLSQCTLKQTCAGLSSGYCPSFQSWNNIKYHDVYPICALIKPNNCYSMDLHGLNKQNTVECKELNINGILHNVIYSCVDATKYKIVTNSFLLENVSTYHLEACKSNHSNALCNGCGTCVPTSNWNIYNYTCKCYAGYKGNTCEIITSSECSAGQCGNGGICHSKTKKCICKNGFMGKKCELCVNDKYGCNNHGTCTNNGKCICHDGYMGSFCNEINKLKPPVEFSIDEENHGNSKMIINNLFFLLCTIIIFIM